MTVTHLPVAEPLAFTTADRKRALAELHTYWGDIPQAAQSVLLATWAPGLDPARRDYLWASYRQERQLEADLRSGWEDWRAVEPELTCDDPQTEAANGALSRANEYLRELAGEKQ